MSAKGMFQSLRHKAHSLKATYWCVPLRPPWAQTHHGNKRRVLALMKVKARRALRHAANRDIEQ